MSINVDAAGGVNERIDVSARIATILRLDPQRPGAQYLGRWETWGEMSQRVDAIDALLSAAGVGKAMPVGLITRTRPPQVAAVQAILATRRCLVPINSIASDDLIIDDVTRLAVPALLADDEDWARPGLIEACRRLGVLGIVLDRTSTSVRLVDGLDRVSVTADPLPGVAVLMPTSGTTGPPKRIKYRYDHINGALGRIARYSAATARSLGGEPALRDGVVIATLALAHISGLWGVLQAAAEGRPVALLDRFDPEKWATLIETHQAKTSSLPPATLRMVMDANIAPERLRSLVSVGCGTAPLDPALADAFTERYGVAVLVSYGATEFPGGTVGWTLEDHRAFWKSKKGSAGRPRPGIAIRIIDADTGEVLPNGVDGILSVRSPQATTESTDGWVRTTDIGHIDDDGFLWLVGRADDAINRGGFKIVPQVVEAVLREHPAVSDAAVVGVSDDRLGQVPMAAVTVTTAVEQDELREWVRKHLASYQVPSEIRILGSLPRTASLKVSKDEIRRLFAAPTQGDER
ncbi:MAG: class I adenylate-forming enzyme family protein [Acidimicrobiia bacterium]